MPADFKPPHSPQLTSSISYFPYFDSLYLAVAASLNGGNVLATFVEMLTTWMKELSMYFYLLSYLHMKQNIIDISRDKMYLTD